MRRLLGQPTATWRRIVGMTIPRERALNTHMMREFRRVAALAASNVAGGLEPESNMKQHDAQVMLILRASYTELMPQFGKLITNAAEGKAARINFEALVQRWIETEAARKVAAISETTRKQLRAIIGAAREEGLGTDAIARRIREELGGVIAKVRSHVIARTETHSAANTAQQFAAQSLGRDDMKREWIAASDERTREDHAAADGQVVGLDQPFEVGGVSLMFPGEAGGPPDQIINCRCTTGFLVP